MRSVRLILASVLLGAAGMLPLGAQACTCLWNNPNCGPRVNFNWNLQGTEFFAGWFYDNACVDFYNVRVALLGRSQFQVKVDADRSCSFPGGCAKKYGGQRGLPYRVQVQACEKRFGQSSACSAWGESWWLPFGEDTCKVGFVWRDAFAGDHVCVTPTDRSAALQANQLAASRRVSSGGHSGPMTCKPPFVWREADRVGNATGNDRVCVPEPDRRKAWAQNAARKSNMARPR